MDLKPKIFTQLFLVLNILFLISCHSTPNTNISTDIIKKKSLQFIPYEQENWKIIRQEVVYEDGIHFSSIASIWIYDKNFPLELVTLDSLTPSDTHATYHEGDKILLRSTDAFYPASESLSTELYDDDFTACNEEEFRMFARIYNGFNYTGILFNNSAPTHSPWFKFGNLICVKIEHDTSNKIGLLQK